VEEQQPAHITCKFRFVWEQERAEDKLFSFCACTSDLGALEGDPARDWVLFSFVPTLVWPAGYKQSMRRETDYLIKY
jgi:hypothetical protein